MCQYSLVRKWETSRSQNGDLKNIKASVFEFLIYWQNWQFLNKLLNCWAKSGSNNLQEKFWGHLKSVACEYNSEFYFALKITLSYFVLQLLVLLKQERIIGNLQWHYIIIPTKFH